MEPCSLVYRCKKIYGIPATCSTSRLHRPFMSEHCGRMHRRHIAPKNSGNVPVDANVMPPRASNGDDGEARLWGFILERLVPFRIFCSAWLVFLSLSLPRIREILNLRRTFMMATGSERYLSGRKTVGCSARPGPRIAEARQTHIPPPGSLRSTLALGALGWCLVFATSLS